METPQECILALSVPPTIYSQIRSIPYILCLQLPLYMYCLCVLVHYRICVLDNRRIVACNPPDAFPKESFFLTFDTSPTTFIVVNNIRNSCGLGIGCIVLILYICIIAILIRVSDLRPNLIFEYVLLPFLHVARISKSVSGEHLLSPLNVCYE
ncbi:hypothetical protein PRIPAC_97080, partial [Pristionchus pacificus]|uniref:Uncharacterized protein n=1 Tax=Pristionchus pacificus TaxID=54126 RepID=A0A2A6CUB0_PRIPA